MENNNKESKDFKNKLEKIKEEVNIKEVVLVGIFILVVIGGIIRQEQIGNLNISNNLPGISSGDGIVLKTKPREREIQTEIYRQGDSRQKIGILNIQGEIKGGQPTLFNGQVYNHQLILDTIEAFHNTEDLKAVIVQLNTPGGSVYQSKEVYERLKELKEKKEIPIYALMETVCASGGVYIAMAADTIMASPDTTTGSIGTLLKTRNLAGLHEKLGVEDVVIKSNKHKDIGSSSRKMTEEEKEILQRQIDEVNNRFIQVVAEGRNRTEEEVRIIATGETFTGTQAVENGLVDELGFFKEMIELVSEEQNLDNPTILKVGNVRSMNPFSSILLNTHKTSEFIGIPEMKMERIEEVVVE